MRAPRDSRPPDVTILHAAGDDAWACWLHEQTAHLGFTVHSAARDLVPGLDRVSVCERGLTAPHVLALLSHRALLDARFVGALSAAIDRMHAGRTTLIPVLTEPRDDIPALLGSIEPLSLVMADERRAVRLLAHALGMSEPPDASPFPHGSCWPGHNPFPGLAAYDFEQAALFGGRRADIETCLEALSRRPWLRIEGASGHGKSSLARAGLLPALARGQPPFRPHAVAIIRPAGAPLRNLARELARLADAPVETVYETLTDSDPRRVQWWLEENLDRPLALLVDQFEEALHPGRATIALDRLDTLLATALSTNSIRLITTLRSDWAPDIDQMPALADRVRTHSSQHLLLSMDAHALSEALSSPLTHHGLSWPEPELPRRIIADALDRQRSDTDGGAVLPLVAHVAHTLWSAWATNGTAALSLASYEQLGGVAGALAESADHCIEALPRDMQPLAVELLLHLVRPGRGTADARAPMRRDALIAAVQRSATDLVTDEDIDRVLCHLSGAPAPDLGLHISTAPPRLVRVSRADGAAAEVELLHEALLTAWPRLTRAIGSHRQRLERREERRAEVARWVEHGRQSAWLPNGARLRWLRGVDLLDGDRRALNADRDDDTLAFYRAATAHLAHEEATEAATAHELRRRARLALALAVVCVTAAAVAGVLALAAWEAHDQKEATVGKLVELLRDVQRTARHALAGPARVREARQTLFTTSGELVDDLHTRERSRLDVRRQQRESHYGQCLIALADESDDASRPCSRAVALAQGLSESGEPEDLTELSLSLDAVGRSELSAGDFIAARRAFAESLTISRALMKADPGDIDHAIGASYTMADLGDVACAAGDFAECRTHYLRGIELGRWQHMLHPDEPWAAYHYARMQRWLGDHEYSSGSLHAADRHFGDSLDTLVEIARRDQFRERWFDDVSAVIDAQSWVHRALGHSARAQDNLVDITRRMKGWVVDMPNLDLQRALVQRLESLAWVQLERHQLPAARATIEDGLRIARLLVATYPDDPALARTSSSVMSTAGALAAWAGDMAASRASYDAACATLSWARRGDRAALAACLDGIGWASLLAGDPHEARSAFEEAVEIRRTLARERPHDPSRRWALAEGLLGLAELEWRSGKPDVGERISHESVAMLASLARARPDHALIASVHADALRYDAYFDQIACRHGEAEPALSDIVARQRTLTRYDFTNPGYSADLGWSLMMRCQVRLRLGELDAARADCRESYQLAREFVREPSADRLARQWAIRIALDSAAVALIDGDTDSARRLVDEGLSAARRDATSHSTDTDTAVFLGWAHLFELALYDHLEMPFEAGASAAALIDALTPLVADGRIAASRHAVGQYETAVAVLGALGDRRVSGAPDPDAAAERAVTLALLGLPRLARHMLDASLAESPTAPALLVARALLAPDPSSERSALDAVARATGERAHLSQPRPYEWVDLRADMPHMALIMGRAVENLPRELAHLTEWTAALDARGRMRGSERVIERLAHLVPASTRLDAYAAAVDCTRRDPPPSSRRRLSALTGSQH